MDGAGERGYPPPYPPALWGTPEAAGVVGAVFILETVGGGSGSERGFGASDWEDTTGEVAPEGVADGAAEFPADRAAPAAALGVLRAVK